MTNDFNKRHRSLARRRRLPLALSLCINGIFVAVSDASSIDVSNAASVHGTTKHNISEDPHLLLDGGGSGGQSSDDDDDEDAVESSSDFDDVDLSDTGGGVKYLVDERILNGNGPGPTEDTTRTAAAEVDYNEPDQSWTENQQHLESEEQEPYDFEDEGGTPPLKTLKKLQQMLDKTDYLTSSPTRTDSSKPPPSQHEFSPSVQNMRANPSTKKMISEQKPSFKPPEIIQKQIGKTSVARQDTPRQQSAPPPQSKTNSAQIQTKAETDKLWTSKDRQKYKKMQQMQRRAQEERRRLQRQLMSPLSSDDEGTDTDTDDGLGYTLPNLPVYLSDAEGEGSDSEMYDPQHRYSRQQSFSAQQTTNPYNQQGQPGPYRQLPPSQQAMQRQQQQQYPYSPYGGVAPNGQMPWPYPPPPMPYPTYGYGSGWTTYQYPPPPFNPQQSSITQKNPPPQTGNQVRSPPKLQEIPKVDLSSKEASNVKFTIMAPTLQQMYAEPSPRLASSTINFDSIQKIAFIMLSVVLLAYCAVSPRTLPLVAYNRKFNENLGVVALSTLFPIFNFLLVCDAQQNDVNDIMSAFYSSFIVGYLFSFVMEIVLATFIRLGVFALWEPSIFEVCPKVPSLVLPWVLREQKYRPKRITLFAADFFTSCVSSPLIEEYVKFKILQLSIRLPRNFRWIKKKSSKTKKTKRVAEAITNGPGEAVVNINSYVTTMLAVSVGMKLSDSIRRILMYTKSSHANKSFYAICRGIFPIHELCGTMTALALARRDVLGVDMPLWKILSLPVVIHGMANFRGKKPIFKWNSATPWSEMQLSPWNIDDASTLSQLLSKSFAKLMWVVILLRVLGYCIKNYYLISRQARKRATTYLGKRAAFAAELEAAEMLKKKKT